MTPPPQLPWKVRVMRSRYRSKSKDRRKKLNMGLLTLILVMSVITIVTYARYLQEKERYENLLETYRNLKEEVESQKRINAWFKEVIEKSEKVRDYNVPQANEGAGDESESSGRKFEGGLHTEKNFKGTR